MTKRIWPTSIRGFLHGGSVSGFQTAVIPVHFSVDRIAFNNVDLRVVSIEIIDDRKYPDTKLPPNVIFRDFGGDGVRISDLMRDSRTLNGHQYRGEPGGLVEMAIHNPLNYSIALDCTFYLTLYEGADLKLGGQ